MNRTGAQHDLAGGDFLGALAIDMHDDGGGATVFDNEAIDQRVAANFQVGAAARRFQIGLVGRDPAQMTAVDRIAGNALAIGAVDVIAP